MFLSWMNRAGALAILTLIANMLTAQTALPEFQVIQRNGWAVVSWNNTNKELTQLIIQRSNDSLKGFKSIITMPDPTSATNGYVDKKPGSTNAYYRIFYVMPGSRYVFTDAKKPVPEDPIPAKPAPVQQTVQSTPTTQPVRESKTEPLKTTAVSNTSATPIVTDSSKTVYNLPYQRVELKRENWKPVLQAPKIDSIPGETIFNPSAFIFTNADGNLIIALPDVNKKKFTLRVFRDDNTPVFEMRHIRESQLLIDRSNFHQSGWFRYELLEADRIKEKNRFYIKPDGK
jgi:hypothetical protein